MRDRLALQERISAAFFLRRVGSSRCYTSGLHRQLSGSGSILLSSGAQRAAASERFSASGQAARDAPVGAELDAHHRVVDDAAIVDVLDPPGTLKGRER